MNNLVLTFPESELGDLAGLWKAVFELSVTSFSIVSQYSDYCSPKIVNDIQNITTAILYSILKKTTEIVIEEAHITWLLKALETNDEQIRANLIGIVGLLLKSPAGTAIVEPVTAAILRALDDPSLWVITEALDIIFCVFDDLYNEIFIKYNFANKLQQMKTFLQKKLKEGVTEEILQDRINEGIENIPEFLKYKKKPKETLNSNTFSYILLSIT